MNSSQVLPDQLSPHGFFSAVKPRVRSLPVPSPAGPSCAPAPGLGDGQEPSLPRAGDAPGTQPCKGHGMSSGVLPGAPAGAGNSPARADPRLEELGLPQPWRSLGSQGLVRLSPRAALPGAPKNSPCPSAAAEHSPVWGCCTGGEGQCPLCPGLASPGLFQTTTH